MYIRILISSLILALLVFAGCEQLGESLTKVVFMEYDQSLNFRRYGFEKTIGVPNYGEVSWIEAQPDFDSEQKGVWILYQVCSIRNDAPQAQPFNYDLSKFYVEYGGKKHYHTPLAAGTYSVGSFSGGNAMTKVLAPEFRTETQIGPDQQLIAVNPNNTLSISWRFVIYVSTHYLDKTDLLTLNLPLRYDATPVLMLNRNNDPVRTSGTVYRKDLPIICRPPKQ